MTYQEFKANRDAFTVDEYANVKPVEELEKVKDKMMDDGAYFQEVEGHTDFVKGISHCINIIDAEISKLKGEEQWNNFRCGVE